jgi:hypothetical protein
MEGWGVGGGERDPLCGSKCGGFFAFGSDGMKSGVASRYVLTRLRITLGQQRAKAKNQLQAVLHQEGFRKPVSDVFGKQGRAWPAGLALSEAARVVVEVWLKVVDQMDEAIREPRQR